MRLMKSGLVAALMTMTAATAEANNPNLVLNGDFEATSNGPAQFDNNTLVTNWSSTGYNFLFGPGTADTTGSTGAYGALYMWGFNNGGDDVFTDSPTGGNFVAADGAFGVAPVQQTLSGLTFGKQYNVEFDWAAAQQQGYTGNTTEQWQVSLGGQTISTDVYHNPSHAFSGWMHEKFTFTYDGANSLLSFLAIGTPDGKPPFSLLDGVSVEAVPEPATWAMMMVGFGAIGVTMRRRRARALA